jgi:phosphoribosyl-AMP cyclohydrolase
LSDKEFLYDLFHGKRAKKRTGQRSRKWYPGEIIMIELDFTKDKDGLLPAIVQDAISGDVLMLAYINQESWTKTLTTGKAHFWSRSRQKLWLKGETSGHVQLIREILVDCDQDTVVFKVEQLGGAACHKGYCSCFFRRVVDEELETVGEKVFDPATVYGK